MTEPRTTGRVGLGFERQCARLAIADIEPRRQITVRVKRGAKYRQILSSIREVGMIEPPLVARTAPGSAEFLLVAGHLRIEALKDLGIAEVVCLIATDDEAFTSNKHVSRIATVQQVKMMRKAVALGVAPDRIAAALNIDVETLKGKLKLLDGICAEALMLLKDKQVPATTFHVLRRMAPLRQIEVCEFMIMMNDYTARWANRLLATTAREQLANPDKAKTVRGLSPRQLELITHESGNIDRQLKLVEQSYGSDHLELMIARSYLGNLLGNARVVRYLAQHQKDMLQELQKLTDMNIM